MRAIATSLGTLLLFVVVPSVSVGGAEPSTPETPATIPEDAVFDVDLEPARGRVSASQPFESGRTDFEVRLDGQAVTFRIHSLLVLPGSQTVIEAESGTTLRYAAGQATSNGSGRWAWEAPETPGIVPLRLEDAAGHTVDLVALVLHPASFVEGGVLGGYRIGDYRGEPLRGLPQFLPPQGFVEADAADEDIRISPHFTLGELLCKQPGAPRYMTFTGALLTKLELVLEEANDRGIEVGTLTVMSGFRTPWYNRSIGNTTDYSRHLWGDAADVFIDRDGNGEMDDLDGDGRSDHEDARVLSDIVESLGARGDEGFTVGGMSVYRRNAAHGPFVHVDARGERARW
jgi:hypothetical protein